MTDVELTARQAFNLGLLTRESLDELIEAFGHDRAKALYSEDELPEGWASEL